MGDVIYIEDYLKEKVYPVQYVMIEFDGKNYTQRVISILKQARCQMPKVKQSVRLTKDSDRVYTVRSVKKQEGGFVVRIIDPESLSNFDKLGIDFFGEPI